MARTSRGFSSLEVSAATGLTLRQVQYWVLIGFVLPSVYSKRGRGNHDRFNLLDVLTFRILAAMRARGVSLQALRQVQRYLQGRDFQSVYSHLIWAPGNRRYRHDIALVHSESEMESLLASPGQLIDPVTVDVQQLFREARARLEEIRDGRPAIAAAKRKQRAERKRERSAGQRRASKAA